MRKKIELVKDRVKRMLEKDDLSRDNDSRLVALIWYNETKNFSDSKIEFLARLSRGQITSSESITRARRKIQEEIPELRGKSYKERTGKLEADVRDWSREKYT